MKPIKERVKDLVEKQVTDKAKKQATIEKYKGKKLTMEQWLARIEEMLGLSQ